MSVPEHEDPHFFDKVESFAIRFSFYYDRDFGVGSHAHDLEVVEMQVALADSRAGLREVRLRKVVGFAHGTDWYSNELHVEADTRPADRRAPPSVEAATPAAVLSSHDRADQALERYVLRPAAEVPACQVTGPEPDRLLRMMRRHRFGADYAADQYHLEQLRDLAEPLTGTGSMIPSLGARWDGRLGMTVELRGSDLRLLYLVPKINWVRRDLGVEALSRPRRAGAQLVSERWRCT